MFSQNQKPHPTQHNSPPWSDSHTHAALVLRTPSQLPAQEGPWLSCTELCETQISEPACPRAQDIVLQSKETCSSFLSPCRRLMLLPYFLLAEMVSHPKRRGGHKLPLFFLPEAHIEPLRHVPVGSSGISVSKAETQENTFPGLCPMEEIAPPRAGATQGSRPNELCQV